MKDSEMKDTAQLSDSERNRKKHFSGSAVFQLAVLLILALASLSSDRKWTNSFQRTLNESAYISIADRGGNQITQQPNYIPLHDLVDTKRETECPPGLVLVEDIRTPPANTSSLEPRKIPRIIHVTSKSRCVTPKIAEVLSIWNNSSQDHQFYIHNDAALHRLIFEKQWPQFPSFSLLFECANSMVEHTDLWRALILWEYGGIYTDIDNLPKNFNPSTTLKRDDESFFEVEQGGWLSQYFFAAQPRHPLMYLLVMHIWQRIFSLTDLDQQYAPFVTGPGALKNAMKDFMKTSDKPVTGNPCLVFEKVCEGHYVGLDNRTVTVAPRTSAVHRGVIRGKSSEYERMNMTHFGSKTKEKKFPPKQTCMSQLYLATNSKWGNAFRSAE